MQSPGKFLDLIEATEISAERLNYKFTDKQTILLNRLKSKAEKGMSISNNYWELLCNLFNEVEGRKPRNDFSDDGVSTARMLVFYLIVPLTFLAIGFFVSLAYFMSGGR